MSKIDVIAFDADDTLWQHEHSDPPSKEQPRFYQLEHIGQLPSLLEQLEGTEME